MPDLTVQAYWQCKSAEDWQVTIPSQSGGQPHIVCWNRHGHKNHEVQYDYSCDCKSYQMRGTCSHIKKVIAEGRRCGWMQFTDGGDITHDQNGQPCCPKCGGPVASRNWGV